MCNHRSGIGLNDSGNDQVKGFVVVFKTQSCGKAATCFASPP